MRHSPLNAALVGMKANAAIVKNFYGKSSALKCSNSMLAVLAKI